MRLKLWLLAFLFIPGIVFALEPSAALKKAVPNLAQVGEARLSTLLFDVYDIALFAPDGRWQEDKPQILSVRYLLSIDGVDIAERSVDEMKRQGFSAQKLAEWRMAMEPIFPDVKNGTVLTAYYQPNKETRFFKDGIAIGAVKDPDFGRAFLGIWLKETTGEPEIRAKLLGAS